MHHDRRFFRAQLARHMMGLLLATLLLLCAHDVRVFTSTDPDPGPRLAQRLMFGRRMILPARMTNVQVTLSVPIAT